MIKISNIKIGIDRLKEVSHIEKYLLGKLAEKYKINQKTIERFIIFKESIDARKGNVDLVYTCGISLFDPKMENNLVKKYKEIDLYVEMPYEIKRIENIPPDFKRPIIIGFGPAGMFAALILAEAGLRPLVLERGKSVDQRTKDIELFWEKGILDEESNVQFGEGGAGTFSDGKLTSRSKDNRSYKVLECLVEHGAPKEILYKNKPHVGTDLLKDVVINIRNTIIAKGGEIRFNTKVDGLIIDHGKIIEIKLNNGEQIQCDDVIMAIGHSARDTFEALNRSGVTLAQKPFAMGVRIEHPQYIVNRTQYKNEDHAEILGAADYFLTYQTKEGRSVYTFCMCPGGEVVAASSEKGHVVTNGMSYHARDQVNANAALLVNITTSDFESEEPLAGISLQRKLEKAAYEYGGGNYSAPIQTIGGFLNGNIEPKGSVEPSYKPSVKFVDLNKILPEFMANALKEAIPEMGKKMAGFDMPEGLLTGIETRTSSPVRIVRDEFSLESVNVKGLYPCGEGAGYAGGIVSSAIDGIKVAEKIIGKCQV